MTDVESGPVARPVPFDPEVAAALATLGLHIPASFTAADIPARRELTRTQFGTVTQEDLVRDGAFTVSEHTIPGPDGTPEITLLVCLPTGASTPTPAMYYIHGGGMIMGERTLGMPTLLEMAEPLGLAVVSVEYRLAPEHPHPAPVEDCYTGLVWTVEHADKLNIDPDRVLIMGASAGGGLAAATALLARDRGGPALLAQWLGCPMLDDRNNTVSAYQMAGIGVWDRQSNEIGWTALLGDACGGPDVSPYAAPARATDLSGLPPTFLDVGSAETFRDEVVDYASRIWEAGGSAELHVWPGGCHGFAAFAPQAALSQVSLVPGQRWLERVLDTTVPDTTVLPHP
jgi:acetyl esterase/lipase